MRKNMRKNYLENTKVAGDVMFELKESELNTDFWCSGKQKKIRWRYLYIDF